MIHFLSGAIVMGYWVAGLYFLRFWRRSRDRLFAVFGAAFWLLGLQRLALATRPEWNDEYGSIYLLRLLAFLMILGAVVDKNRGGRVTKRQGARLTPVSDAGSDQPHPTQMSSDH